MNSFFIYNAKKEDLSWVNSQYASIGFLPSSIENETIDIAEYNGQKCGLGRLIYIDDNNVELSGIYVLENYRKQGIAQNIIRFLLKDFQQTNKTIWCLPFKFLTPFYESFGLAQVNEVTTIPKSIAKKRDWCHENYETEVVLLYKHI
ncbi:MAG: GNAT family N-acetyltransferase [Saprospiraceae bacterium]|nr:GNAT family N-acetyltransferase [Bacteroidia bacterium]NNE15025.1 GNAT family N-acetyltransferase [Saprospiraceae bacterium]NNL91333.1 GNAT family N-acetyltransferase [Saprospiraceae bacterium]